MNYNFLTNAVLFLNSTLTLATYLYTAHNIMPVISYYATEMLAMKKITLVFAKLFISQGGQKGSYSKLRQTLPGRPFPGPSQSEHLQAAYLSLRTAVNRSAVA